MKIGDTVHNAIWLTGDEPEGMKDHYENKVKESITYLCAEQGFVHGGYKVSEHRPDADLSKYLKKPGVPVQGSKVRLLVVESDVVDETQKVEIGSFVHNLERKDLMKLRKITRNAYVKYYKSFPSQEEVDEIIEELGPDAAVETLRDS